MARRMGLPKTENWVSPQAHFPMEFEGAVSDWLIKGPLWFGGKTDPLDFNKLILGE